MWEDSQRKQSWRWVCLVLAGKKKKSSPLSLTVSHNLPQSTFEVSQNSTPTCLLPIHLVRLWFFQWSFMDVRVECWKIDAFELWCWRRLLSPLDCKEIQPVHPEDQSWVFIGRTNAEAETPILWPPDEKSWLIGKDPDAGRDWGQEEKEMTEDEMARWHHQLDEHEFE